MKLPSHFYLDDRNIPYERKSFPPETEKGAANVTRSIVVSSLILASSLSAQDTVHVKVGWNIIGSVKAGAIPEVLSTIPESLITSPYWGYAPGVGYKSTDTLETGLGYWVKAKTDGLIIFQRFCTAQDTIYIHDTIYVEGICGTITIPYAGKIYHTVKIGNQCWLNENLDVGQFMIDKFCYSNDTNNCSVYGGLYRWDWAMLGDTSEGVRGICPLGWHIPTLSE